MGELRLVVPSAIVVAAVTVGAWAGSRAAPRTVAWSRAQAESVAVVRGMPVRVLRCDGVGSPAKTADRVALYERFACTAAARASFETYDTVGVTYALRPLGPFAGERSRYALEDVAFSALSVP